MLFIPLTTHILLIPSQELLQPQSSVEEALVRDFLFTNDEFASAKKKHKYRNEHTIMKSEDRGM